MAGSHIGLRISRLERRELTWLIVGFAVCVLLLAFVALAGKVTAGDTTALDTHILRALRRPADLSRPVGPLWLESMMLDLTAVGGPTVLGLVVFAVVGFLLLQERYRAATVVAFSLLSAMLVTTVLKQVFERPRPTVVPHLRDVASSSFPSGHAMQSAIVYLTLGAMLMHIAERTITKLYILGMATLLTILVGISRVYLGVHYPTDVIGGWIIGFAWASVCWLGAQWLEARAGVKPE